MHRLTLSVFTCLALLFCTSPVIPGDSVPAPDAERTYSYGSRPRQQLIAYRDRDPARPDARRPGVVILHGGFWYQNLSPGWRVWARRMADSGTPVFNVDYRSNHEARWPAQRSDVLRALRWIRARAGAFGVDPHRLVLLGSSAGGQIATNVGAYGAGKKHVAGVVALSPVVDPYRSWQSEERSRGMTVLRENSALLAGCEPERDTARKREHCRRVWRDMSAVRHATGGEDAPMLLIHSRRDFVPVVHSDALRGAERRRGMAPSGITVVTVQGTGHGGVLLRSPGVVPMVLGWIADCTRRACGGRTHN